MQKKKRVSNHETKIALRVAQPERPRIDALYVGRSDFTKQKIVKVSERRSRCVALYLTGMYDYKQIVEQLKNEGMSTSLQTVCADIKRFEEQANTNFHRNIEEHQSRELSRLNFLEDFATQALTNLEVELVADYEEPVKDDDGNVIYNAAKVKPMNLQTKINKSKDYINALLAISAARRKLLGMDAPTRMVVERPDDPLQLDASQLSREVREVTIKFRQEITKNGA